MGSFIRSLIKSGNVPLYVDFRTGSLKDLGGQSNDPSVLTGLLQSQSEYGHGLRFPTYCSCSIPDDASLNLTSLSLIALLKQSSLGNDKRIACKRGTANYWDLYVSAVGQLTFKSGGSSVASVLSPYTQAVSLGVTWVTTNIPRAFRNGSLVGAMSGALTAGGSGAGVLNIGSYSAGSVSNAWNDIIHAVVLVNEALSDADVARLHRELVAEPSVVSRPSKHFSIPYPAKTPAEYAAEGIILDVNGTGVDCTGLRPATPSGHLDKTKEGPFADGLAISENGLLTLPANDAEIYNTANWEVSGWLKWSGATGDTENILLGNGGYYVQKYNTNRLVTNRRSAAAANLTAATTNNSIVPNKWQHFCVQSTVAGSIATGNTNTKVWLDSVLNADFTWLGVGVLLPGASAPTIGFAVGKIGLSLAKLTYRTTVLTPAQIREEYLKGARKCLLDARVHSDGSCPVSLAAVGAGNELANGWKVQSGTWKVVEDAPANGIAGKRWMKSQAAATISIACDKQAYGSWHNEFRFNGVEHEWLFVATNGTSVSSAAQNGYGVHVTAVGAVTVRERVAGVASTLLTPGITLVSGQRYQFWATRRFDGVIQIWVKGGAYTDWRTFGTVTDTTTTSGGFQVQYGAGANVESAGVLQLLGEQSVFEAIRAGILEGEIPEPFWTVSTTDTTQNWTMRLTSGAVYVFDWGDGQQTWHTGNGASQAIAHTYAIAGTYEIKVYTANPTLVTGIYSSSNSLSGSLASLSACTTLQVLTINNNSFAGTLTSFSLSPTIRDFVLYSNAFTGQLPDFSLNTAFQYVYLNNCVFTGYIPSLTANIALVVLRLYSNVGLTGYTASTLSTTITEFRVNGCALTQTAVDQILIDFTTGAAGRPGAGTIVLNGGTNAVPTPAIKAACVAALPGWTITTN